MIAPCVDGLHVCGLEIVSSLRLSNTAIDRAAGLSFDARWRTYLPSTNVSATPPVDQPWYSCAGLLRLRSGQLEEWPDRLRLDCERGRDQRFVGACVVHPQRDRVGQGRMPQLLCTIHPREHPRAGRRCRQ